MANQRGDRIVGVVMLVLVAMSCGGDDTATDMATSPPQTSSVAGSVPATTEADSKVTVTPDLTFADSAPDLVRWSEASLDVYAPSGRSGLPLVIVLPPHNLTKENAASAQLASALAEQGAVAVVANWSELDDPVGSFQDPSVLEEVARTGQSFAGCAVSFAVSRAEDFGADPSRLVLVGELFGANTASVLALSGHDLYSGCTVTDVSWSASGLVGVNGDWLVGFPVFDPVGAAAIEYLSPWPLFDRAPMIPTVFAVTEDAIDVTQLCDEPDTWLTSRDADGSMRARLDAIGAADDGCIDIGESADATAAEMSSRGYEVEVMRLVNSDGATMSDEGAHVDTFGPADLELLLPAIMAVAE